jgi:hypothetical protein
LTLIVVPVLYRYEARAHDRREDRRQASLATRRAERLRIREAQVLESRQPGPADQPTLRADKPVAPVDKPTPPTTPPSAPQLPAGWEAWLNKAD